MSTEDWLDSARIAVEGARAYPGAKAFDSVAGVSDAVESATRISKGDYRGAVLAGVSALGGKAKLPGEIFQEVLNRAKWVGDRLESVLDDGYKVIFRRDVGERAHPLSASGESVDHWNIEVQRPIPGRPGRYEQVHNTHVILDESGNPVEILNSR
jgi:hypothetical protein